MVVMGEPDKGWLNGKYDEGEINTRLSFVSFGDFYCQGHEADEVIEQIHEIWLTSGLTQQGAVTRWISSHL